MKRLFSTVTLLALATFILSSCATVFTGTSDMIQFETEPEGVSVVKNNMEICETPCSHEIERDLSDVYVTFEKSGYENKRIKLERKFNVVSVLNFGNMLGWGIDAVTGAVFKYEPTYYDLELDKE
ncbi:MAG: hypothetical protein K9H65_05780 [Bacteroidales bacterium]|nr:hypothetical protein [Bacteroidales bacterium]